MDNGDGQMHVAWEGVAQDILGRGNNYHSFYAESTSTESIKG